MYHFDTGSDVTADSLTYYRDNLHLLGKILEAGVHFRGSSDRHGHGQSRRRQPNLSPKFPARQAADLSSNSRASGDDH
jgi:hypothetical protein